MNDRASEPVEISTDFQVPEPITVMTIKLIRLDTRLAWALSPVMEDLYESRGFLGSEVLPERREEFRLVAGDDE